MRRALFLSLVAALLGLTACASEAETPRADEAPEPVGDPGDNVLGSAKADGADSFQPALENVDALFRGVPSNDELPDMGEGRDGRLEAESFDLVPLQSPVRSQQSRGVCSIFSTVGLMEHLYIAEGTITEPDFSEQYLQWSAKFQAGRFTNTSGSNAQANLGAINRYGVPWESAWPYEGTKISTWMDEPCSGDERPTECYTNGHPPDEAMEARLFDLPRGQYIRSSANSIKSHMATTGTAVVAGVRFMYQAWSHGRAPAPLETNSEYRKNGWVYTPNAEDVRLSREPERQAGHSILLVGWDDNLEVEQLGTDGQPNGTVVRGFFLFKNSWGTGRFGVVNEVPHPETGEPIALDGYGWISYDYIEEWGNAYGVGRLPSGVEPYDPSGGMEPGAEVLEGVYEDTMPTCGDTCEIPDNDPTGVSATIEVEDSGAVGRLIVDLAIDHTWRGDLAVTLEAPTGEIFRVVRNAGLDGAIEGSFPIAEASGMDAAGTWTLHIRDTASRDTGSLRQWGLVFEAAE